MTAAGVELVIFSLCVYYLNDPNLCDPWTQQHKECKSEFGTGTRASVSCGGGDGWGYAASCGKTICLPCDQLYPPMKPIPDDDPRMQMLNGYHSDRTIAVAMLDKIQDCAAPYLAAIDYLGAQVDLRKVCTERLITKELWPPYDHWEHPVTPCVAAVDPPVVVGSICEGVV